MGKHYAIPSKQKYPIETSEQVKIASDYFDDNYRRMGVNDRAEYAHSLNKRASELGVKVASCNVINYSNRGVYSPEFEQNMLLRKIACSDQGVTIKGTKDEFKVSDLIQKLASNKDKVTPEQMVSMVYELDKVAGLESSYDHSIKDAYFTVFGCTTDPYYVEKIAAENHWLTEAQIKAFAELPGAKDTVMTYFGENFAQDFISAPFEKYKALNSKTDKEAFHQMYRNSSK